MNSEVKAAKQQLKNVIKKQTEERRRKQREAKKADAEKKKAAGLVLKRFWITPEMAILLEGIIREEKNDPVLFEKILSMTDTDKADLRHSFLTALRQYFFEDK